MSSRKPKKTSKKTKANSKSGIKKRSSEEKPEIKVKSSVPGRWIARAAIIGLAFLLYGMSLPYEFVLDDKLVLSENSFVKKGFGGINEILSNESFTGFFGEQKDLVAGARYRPLSLVSYALEVEFFGINPKVHRFVNILLYGLTGVALFHMMFLLFPVQKERHWWLGLAFTTSILFVLHPVHIEAVANIKGRDEIMALLFSLLTFNAVLKYVSSNNALWLIGAAFSFFMAMMSKENSIAFLAVIPLALFLFSKSNLKKIAGIVLPLVIVAGVYIIIRYQVIGYFLDSGKEQSRLLINNPFLDMTVAQKYATIVYTLLLDLKLLFFPHPLTSDYNPYHIPIMNWTDWQVVLSLVVYLALALFVILRFRKNKVIAFCILYFVATIFLVSNLLFPVGSFMNERFLFMPSVAACLFLGWLITEIFPKKWKMELVGYGLLGVLIIGFVAKTIVRLPDWKNSDTLTISAVKVSNNSARANSFYAYQLYRSTLNMTDPAAKKAIFDKALPHAEKAISIYPDYSDALTAKAGILAGYYQMDNQLKPLLDGFYSILEVRPIGFITQYLEYLNGQNAGPELADFYYKTGYGLYAIQLQNYQLALQHLNYGNQVAPGDVRFLSGLSAVHYNLGNYQQSLEYGLQALQQQPGHAFTNYIVGLSHQKLGNTAEGDIYLNKAYSVDPSLRNRQ